MKRTKYGAIRTNGFASRKESKRYDALALMQKAGIIRRLECQVKHPLTVNGVLICSYVSDFEYEEQRAGEAWWTPVVEDVKGVRTSTYKIKAKLMLALHGIAIRET